MAPAIPPGIPPNNKAANTQNVFPKWKEVYPTGVGILICKKTMDEIGYARKNDENVLTMTKKL